MAKKSTVKLRVFKGQRLSYNQDGSIQNENQLITLPHNRVEWINFLDKIKMHNYCKVDVISANYITKEKDKESFFVDVIEPCAEEEINAIKAEVEKAMKEPEQPMSADQKRIAELESALKKMQKAIGKSQPEAKENKVKDINVSVDAVKDDELTKVREEYESVVGKKPFHGWDVKTLKEKIEESKS